MPDANQSPVQGESTAIAQPATPRDASCPERYAQAVAALEVFLDQEFQVTDGRTTTVVCYDNGHGIRIAEVSVANETGGWSTMRCDPEAGSTLLACEDFVLTYDIKPFRPEGWTDDLDEHADAKWKLHSVIKQES